MNTNRFNTLRPSSSLGEYPQPYLGLLPMEYYGLVKDVINVNTIEDTSRLLERIKLPDGVVIATAGSDGKLERHTQSKTELIVIQKSSSLQGDELLKNFFEKEQLAKLFDTGPSNQIDTKNLDESTPMSFAFNDSNTIFPDRTLNMLPIHPTDENSLDVFFQARERTLIEMSSDKRIKSRLKSQLREYKRAMRTGQYRNIPLFDTENSEQYYSEAWPAYTTGFKVPFLRTVQRKLDVLTTQLGNGKDWSIIARELPTSTLDRIDYLAKSNIIPLSSATKASEAYAWFLQEYHCIQETYKQSEAPMKLVYDPLLFETHKKSIESFSSL